MPCLICDAVQKHQQNYIAIDGDTFLFTGPPHLYLSLAAPVSHLALPSFAHFIQFLDQGLPVIITIISFTFFIIILIYIPHNQKGSEQLPITGKQPTRLETTTDSPLAS